MVVDVIAVRLDQFTDPDHPKPGKPEQFLGRRSPVAQAARTVQVDVTYRGSGKVDANHKIVWRSFGD